MKNYYDILEINQKASKEIMQNAYRILVKRYHPDLNTGENRIYAEQKLKDINEAYKILSDDFLREQYDAELEKEMQYRNSFAKQETRYNNVNRKNIKNKKYTIKNELDESQEDEEKLYKVGSLGSLINLTKTVSKNIPKGGIKNIRNIKKEDLIAAGLTLLIVVILLLILWFLPATNGFVRSLIPFI